MLKYVSSPPIWYLCLVPVFENSNRDIVNGSMGGIFVAGSPSFIFSWMSKISKSTTDVTKSWSQSPSLVYRFTLTTFSSSLVLSSVSSSTWVYKEIKFANN